jgi:hypothetical protein
LAGLHQDIIGIIGGYKILPAGLPALEAAVFPSMASHFHFGHSGSAFSEKSGPDGRY